MTSFYPAGYFAPAWGKSLSVHDYLSHCLGNIRYIAIPILLLLSAMPAINIMAITNGGVIVGFLRKHPRRLDMPEVKYIVTGIDRYNKRFRLTYSNKIIALSINLWQGSVWESIDGKRKLIKRVYN